MKYKKQFATGALAFSLLIGGSNVFAATPQDLGIKNVQPTFQKQNKPSKTVKSKKGKDVVGIVSSINSTGFAMDIKNLKTNVTVSAEVSTNTATVFTKNGTNVTSADLLVGQKVIVNGTLDPVTNIVTAKQVKIVTATTVKTKVNKAKKIAPKTIQ